MLVGCTIAKTILLVRKTSSGAKEARVFYLWAPAHEDNITKQFQDAGTVRKSFDSN